MAQFSCDHMHISLKNTEKILHQSHYVYLKCTVTIKYDI